MDTVVVSVHLFAAMGIVVMQKYTILRELWSPRRSNSVPNISMTKQRKSNSKRQQITAYSAQIDR